MKKSNSVIIGFLIFVLLVFVSTMIFSLPYNLGDRAQGIRQMPQDNEYDMGSGIELDGGSLGNSDELELLGQVWGFLKYHHPAIADGKYNWDYELFRILPTYNAAKNKKDRANILITWIDSLGELTECKECETSSEGVFKEPDLNWIMNQGVGLKEKLINIHRNRNQDEHYYVELVENVMNPNFTNEDAYSTMSYPDDGFRLLSVFRYWNMINYFFPYKYLIDKDWNSVLEEYIPIFISAKDELEYELAVLKLIGEIKDTHAYLGGDANKIASWKGDNIAPVRVKFVENKLVVTDYYNSELKEITGLEVGDVITKINGQPIGKLIDEKAVYYPASNLSSQLRDLSMDLLRSNASEIEISYLRDNLNEETKILKLYPRGSIRVYYGEKRNIDYTYKLLDDNIGYVTLATIKDEDIPRIKEEFKDTKGMIIDIRNYPSTFVPFSLGSYFVSKQTPFVKFTIGSIKTPGEFGMSSSFSIPSVGNPYKKKLMVLINEQTQSSAEYTAMAFRAGDNTTIIGSSTAGADGNVSNILLPGGLATGFSGIGVYYPNGNETQRIGIVPDIEVSTTIEGIRMGRDEVLEKAIELINKD